MITSNVIQRVIQIQHHHGLGTSFTIEHQNREYLVTAGHVVKEIISGQTIKIFHNEIWKTMEVNVVGFGRNGLDVAVLSCPLQLSPRHPLETTSRGLALGQTVYFLGFPFGCHGGAEKVNRGFPLPFVKGGVVSTLPSKSTDVYYIDGHGNKGFSGGPLVFVPYGNLSGELQVAGVIVNYPTPFKQPVFGEEGTKIGYIKENPGIVGVHDIRHVIELIESNPIGFDLSTHVDAS